MTKEKTEEQKNLEILLRQQQDNLDAENLARAIHAENEPKTIRKEYRIKPHGPIESCCKKIFEAFKKKYPHEPITNNTLSFPSQNDAIGFFEEQANLNLKFCFSEIDSNGNPTGLHVFSCGNGKLYKGSFSEIHQQLTEDKKANPNNPQINEGLITLGRIITQEMKRSIQEDSLQEDQEQSHLPNPLRTKNRPGV